MKKTIIFLLSIIYFSVLSNAQETPKNLIQITANFVKGDTIKYTIEEGKKKYKNDNMVDSVVSKKKMNLIVIDSTEKGFLMQIDMENDKKTDDLIADFLKDESNFSFLYAVKDFKLQYRISPVGIFQGFENKDVLKKIMEKTFEYNLTKAKVETEKIEKLKKAFLTPQLLETLLGKYVILLHSFHGYEYEADTVKTFDNPLPNFLSKKGETIPAKSEFLVEYSDSTELYANIQQVTNTNKDAMKNLMSDVGKALSVDKKMKKEIKKLEMNLFQKIDCDYHISSGIPTYFFFKKEVEVIDKDEVSVNLEYIEINII